MPLYFKFDGVTDTCQDIQIYSADNGHIGLISLLKFDESVYYYPEQSRVVIVKQSLEKDAFNMKKLVKTYYNVNKIECTLFPNYMEDDQDLMNANRGIMLS